MILNGSEGARLYMDADFLKKVFEWEAKMKSRSSGEKDEKEDGKEEAWEGNKEQNHCKRWKMQKENVEETGRVDGDDELVGDGRRK